MDAWSFVACHRRGPASEELRRVLPRVRLGSPCCTCCTAAWRAGCPCGKSFCPVAHAGCVLAHRRVPSGACHGALCVRPLLDLRLEMAHASPREPSRDRATSTSRPRLVPVIRRLVYRDVRRVTSLDGRRRSAQRLERGVGERLPVARRGGESPELAPAFEGEPSGLEGRIESCPGRGPGVPGQPVIPG